MPQRKHKVSTFGETKRLLGAGDELPEPILFREKLYVFDENGKRIGRFSLNVDQEGADDDDFVKVFYVHISNRAIIDGNLSESTVTGTVTKKLKTLEEIRYECSEVPNSGKHERRLFFHREPTKYYLSVTNTLCNIESRTNSLVSFFDANGLIGEGANAILLRTLARKGYEGILSFKGILSNGKRCRNYYVTKLSEQMVNGKKMQVLIVYRTLTNHKKHNLTMTMALTRAGQLIYLFWSNSKCFLHIDPHVNVNTSRFFYGDTKLENHWHKDFQLHSRYLEKVDYHLLWIRSFKFKNDELRRILGDFVQYVLLVKPKDIVCFAINFFSPFAQEPRVKCEFYTYPQQFFENTYRDEVYPEWEGENLYLWPNEQQFFGEL